MREQEKESQKITSLESLRGVASLVVVVDHFILAFFPAVFLGAAAVTHSPYEWWLANTPLHIFVNGGFAVDIFFILSGFVLSIGYFSKKTDLVAAAVKRYFRLMPVVLVTITIGYFIYSLGGFHNIEAGRALQSTYLLGLWQENQHWSLLSALFDGFVGTFVITPTGASINPVLWTIYYELIGSLVVFATLALVGSDRRRIYVYALLVIILANTSYAGFIIGMIIADAYVNKPAFFDKMRHLSLVYKLAILVTVIYLGAFDYQQGIFKPLELTDVRSLNFNIIYLAGATMLILLLLTSYRLNKLFISRIFTYIGKISYSIYAIHFIIMGSLATYTFQRLYPAMSYGRAAAITFAVYVAAVFMSAIVLTKYVDQPSLRLSRYIGTKISRMPK